MNKNIRKARNVAAVVLAVAAVPFTASTASAATTTTAAKTAKASSTVTSVHAIGGYVFYNVSYLEAVNLYFAAVAAAPAGYTPPPVTSISATTTVSGTVADSGR